MVLLIAALIVLVPGAATADPITSLLVTTVAGWFGGGAIATALAQLAVSALLYAGASALAKQNARQRPQDLLRELQQPTSLPQYRFVYGHAWAAGTPAPVRVKGTTIYACYILNSRPSEGPFTVLLDKREVVTIGDIYDFAGDGAEATTDPWLTEAGAPYVSLWIGRGEQTSPPARILSEAGDLYDATDAWTGRTVLWARFDIGRRDGRLTRWPSAPPEVIVDGYWSKVWDPRDEAQDPDDQETWVWSANQALCALDALRQNPLKPYDVRNLWMDTWEWAADVADEPVTNKDSSTSARYEVHGTIAFSGGSELEDQLAPLMDAGAAEFVRARGQLGIVPGAPQDVAVTLTDMLDDQPPQLVRYADRDSIAAVAIAKYPARDRAYEMTDAPAYVVALAASEDGGLETMIQPEFSLVPDHRQVQRLQKIAAERSRMQRRLSAVFPPVAFDAVAGSWVEVDLPAPYERWSRIYQVLTTQPAIPSDDDGGVVLRCQMTLREVSESIYDWDAATEEQDVEPYVFDGSISTPEEPTDLTLTTGAGVAIDAVAAVYYSFEPSLSASAVAYEVQYRVDGGAWTAAGTVDAEVDDGTGRVFGLVTPATVGADYEVRVRTLSAAMTSAWVVSDPITASLGVERYRADYRDGDYRLNGATVTLADVLTLTRASTATYVDGSGVVQTVAANEARIDHTGGNANLLIEPAATNLVHYSAALDNAYWTQLRTTVVADAATAPDGTTTADRILDDTTASSTHTINRAAPLSWLSGHTYTSSIFAKAETLSQVAVQLGSGGTSFPTVADWRAVFDLSGGTVVSTGSSVTASIEPMAGGWYRCAVTGVAAAASTETHHMALLAQSGSVTYSGTGTGSILAWGAQVEDGNLSSYIPTTSGTATRAADSPKIKGITAVLDVALRDGDSVLTDYAAQSVGASYWPATAARRIRDILAYNL